jgi:hypothetical protein
VADNKITKLFAYVSFAVFVDLIAEDDGPQADIGTLRGKFIGRQ